MLRKSALAAAHFISPSKKMNSKRAAFQVIAGLEKVLANFIY
jgi:hypothetical protein